MLWKNVNAGNMYERLVCGSMLSMSPLITSNVLCKQAQDEASECKQRLQHITDQHAALMAVKAQLEAAHEKLSKEHSKSTADAEHQIKSLSDKVAALESMYDLSIEELDQVCCPWRSRQ